MKKCFHHISLLNINLENFDLVELNLLKDKLEAKETITASQKKKNINEAIKERKKLAKLKMKKVKDSDQTVDKTKENINTISICDVFALNIVRSPQPR